MKFFIFLAIVGSSTLSSASSYEDVPKTDGFYHTKDYLNGTIITIKLEDGFQSVSTPFIGAAHTPRIPNHSHSIHKRSVYCIPGDLLQLDHEGVDGAVQKWKDLVANGPLIVTSGDFRATYVISVKGMSVTYSVDKPHSTGSLDLEDINFALWWMDNLCPRYANSDYHWDGSPAMEGFSKYCLRRGPGWGVCEV